MDGRWEGMGVWLKRAECMEHGLRGARKHMTGNESLEGESDARYTIKWL